MDEIDFEANKFKNKYKILTNSNTEKSLNYSITILIREYTLEKEFQKSEDARGASATARNELEKISQYSDLLYTLLSKSCDTTRKLLWAQASVSEQSTGLASDTVFSTANGFDLPAPRIENSRINSIAQSLWEQRTKALSKLAKNSISELHSPKRGGAPSESSATHGSPEFRLMMSAIIVVATLGLKPNVHAGYHLAKLVFMQKNGSIPSQWERNNKRKLTEWWECYEPYYLELTNTIYKVINDAEELISKGVTPIPLSKETIAGIQALIDEYRQDGGWQVLQLVPHMLSGMLDLL